MVVDWWWGRGRGQERMVYKIFLNSALCAHRHLTIRGIYSDMVANSWHTFPASLTGKFGYWGKMFGLFYFLRFWSEEKQLFEATGSLFLGFDSSGGIDSAIELIPCSNRFEGEQMERG